MLLMCVGCGASKNDAEDGGIVGDVNVKPSAPSIDEPSVDIEGMPDEKYEAEIDGVLGEVESPAFEGDIEIVPPSVPEIIDPPEIKPQSGLLTAGEWKDLENIEFWQKVLNKNDWYTLMENRNIYARNIIPHTPWK